MAIYFFPFFHECLLFYATNCVVYLTIALGQLGIVRVQSEPCFMEPIEYCSSVLESGLYWGTLKNVIIIQPNRYRQTRKDRQANLVFCEVFALKVMADGNLIFQVFL